MKYVCSTIVIFHFETILILARKEYVASSSRKERNGVACFKAGTCKLRGIWQLIKKLPTRK
jgi:hypothetical protein